MFDIGASELLIIAAVAIIVVGPKDLPGLLRKMGNVMSYAKKLSSDFQSQLNDAVEETGVKDVKKSIEESATVEAEPIEDIDDEFFSDDAFGDVDDEVVDNEPEKPVKEVKKPRKKQPAKSAKKPAKGPRKKTSVARKKGVKA